MAGAGIITGYEDNEFRPLNQITRAETAVIVIRAYDQSVNIPTNTPSPTVVPSVSPSATLIPTGVPAASVSPTATVVPTGVAVPSATPSASATPVVSATVTPTASPTATVAPTPIGIENITPYTTGSNQEWALTALSQLDNSTEKIRLYNYLLTANTYLMLYDEHDYITEYNDVKNYWLNNISSYPVESQTNIQDMINDENWDIDIWYPLDNTFNLSDDEFTQVLEYFEFANPQFFLDVHPPQATRTDQGLLQVPLTIPAYYAFADRRQEVYNNILDTFDNFKSQLESAIDINNKYEVVKYVHDNVVLTLNPDYSSPDYIPLETQLRDGTILAYFGDSKLAICNSYSMTMMYLLNRLGIPTIYYKSYLVNPSTGAQFLHAWNMVSLDNKWYFIDAAWDDGSSLDDGTPIPAYTYFLVGKDNPTFSATRMISNLLIYPEAESSDYSQLDY